MNDEAFAVPEAKGPTRLLRVDVHRRLREDILACRLAPGAEVTEPALAARFAVSKSPVRDALFRLEQEGLVSIMPRQGYRVTPISVKDAQEMFQLRAVLESACVELLARDGTPAALRALDRFRSFEANDYPRGFVAHNRAFHLTLAELTGNSRLRRAMSELIDQMQRVVTVSLQTIPEREPHELVAQHGAIIDAVQAGKGRTAARLVRLHISKAEKRVARALRRSQVVT